MMDRILTTNIRRWVRHQRLVDVSWVSGLLLIATLAAIMMPVSYRAGADHAHPHSVIQGMVDELRGTPHRHHHDGAATTTTQASSLFAFDVPLALSTIGLVDAGAPTSLHRIPFDPVMTIDPDLPVIDSLAIGGDVAGAVTFLSAITALVMMVVLDRRLWTMPQRLRGIVLLRHIPPPRMG